MNLINQYFSRQGAKIIKIGGYDKQIDPGSPSLDMVYQGDVPELINGFLKDVSIAGYLQPELITRSEPDKESGTVIVQIRVKPR